MVLVMATMLLIPFTTTVQSFDLYGAAWQGRYGLPVAMGAFLLGAYALDRSGRDVRGPMQLTMLLLFVVAQTYAVASTAALEGSNFPRVLTILLVAAQCRHDVVGRPRTARTDPRRAPCPGLIRLPSSPPTRRSARAPSSGAWPRSAKVPSWAPSA